MFSAGHCEQDRRLQSGLAALQSFSFKTLGTVALFMSFWQPRSVMQLVIIGFFAALAPVCVAVFFTIQTMQELTDNHRSVTRLVVDVTRMGQDIHRDVLELERRARQFIALGDDDLAILFDRERIALSDELEKLQSLDAGLPAESPDVAALRALLSRLTVTGDAITGLTFEPETFSVDKPRVDQSFDLIGEHSLAIQKWLNASVDQILQKNLADAEAQINYLVFELSLSAIVTLVLLTIFTYWINKPLKDLTHEIQQLGTKGLSHTIDISGPQELRELGGKLEWLRLRLQESMLQKEQFLRHISHELKTPLASLREGTDLLAEHVTGRLSRQQQEIVDIVRQNGIDLQRLIENLIDYNQVPNKKLNPEEIRLKELWDDLLSHYRLSLGRKALHLTSRGSVDYWVADRSKLRTTLDNLLSNAINYTPEGGRIEFVWSKQDTCLVMEVANSGETIPPEDENRVFEPFFQSAAKRTGPIKGSGIGLSVARECMEAQGGSLSLVPHEELPVCFRLICPAH
jgi:two-component system, NtrC family, sensor histidine kinase GlrK